MLCILNLYRIGSEITVFNYWRSKELYIRQENYNQEDECGQNKPEVFRQDPTTSAGPGLFNCLIVVQWRSRTARKLFV